MENFDLQDILLLLGLVAASVVLVIFFLITLQNTLKLIEPQHRAARPGSVWLIFIPVFGLVWSFIIVDALAKSCKAQLEEYGIAYEQKLAYNVGIAWAVSSVLSTVVGYFYIISIVMFIVYWVKINEVRKQLLTLKQLYENKEDGSIL